MENRGIFLLDEDGNLIINKPEITKVTEFKRILTRDKGSKGDSEGRSKFRAFKEFLYIYYMSDPKSIFRDLGKEKRSQRAIEEVGLKDWKPDVIVKYACERYIEILKMTGAEFAYYNASRGLYSMGKDLELFNNANAKLRKRIEKLDEELEGELPPDEYETKEFQYLKAVENLSNNSAEVMKLGKALPAAYTGMEQLYDKMMKEKEGKKEVYGGGEIGNRED